MAAGVQRGGTNPLVTTDGSGGHREEVIVYAPGGTGANPAQGAATTANGQVTTSTTAGTLLAARATRRVAFFKNHDAAITVYVGIATVTAGNGVELKPGESMPWYGVGLVQVIAASGTPVVGYVEFYD